MSALSQFASGFRLFTGESLNALVNVVNNLTGFGTPQAITGTTGTFSSIVNTGGSISAPVVVAAAGATQGTATAIPITATNVVVSITASTEGVKLPAAATGRKVAIWPKPTVGVKIYTAAAGQVINAATTATTAFVLASAKACEFYAIDAVHWRTMKGA